MRLALLFLLVGGGLLFAQEAQPEKKTGFIGIQMDAVAVEGTPAKAAIRILALVPGSPAEALGIKAGDLITRLDDEEIASPPATGLQVFRDKIRTHAPGEKVKLRVVRDAVSVATRVGAATRSEGTGTGASWVELLPDVKKLVEENPGQTVTVSAEKARWERDVVVTLGERPGTRVIPLPENGTLRPDLEAAPLEPEAALAKELVARAGVQASYIDVTHRLDEDEKIEDPFRLKTVRYLKRDPLRLPGATKSLARSLAPGAKAADLAAVVSVSALLLDADMAPILTTQAPAPPPRRSGVQAHVDYCLELMRRSRELCRIALAALTPEEQQSLEKELPELWDRFKETIILYDDEDQARWKRESQAIDLLAKVDRRAYLQALLELAPLTRPAYLEQLALDLKEAEGTPGAGLFYEMPDSFVGTILYDAQTDLGHVVVGGSGPNGYRGDLALVIDIGGDDRYYRRVGSGHGLAQPVGVCLDLDGDDLYTATEPFAQGAALLGVGLLVDLRGDDRYTTLAPFAQGSALCGAAALVDLSGDDIYRSDSYAQGAALAQGLGLLLDRSGKDHYECGIYGQGFAGPGGAGLLLDASGDDHYVCLGRKLCSYGEAGVFDAHGQGSSCGFRGKASGGIALLLDGEGQDVYEAGNFSQGCGYYFGWGALTDMGSGKDRYEGSRYAQAAAAHSALGSLWDQGGDDVYTVAVAAAQGLAWDLCAVAFMDEGGDDRYDGGSGLSQGGSAHNGFTIFYDAEGADRYHLHKKPPAQAGPNDYHGGQSLSFFIEGGGQKNVYDVNEGVAFVPSRGFTVTGERSVFLDLPYRIEKLDKKQLDALYPNR